MRSYKQLLTLFVCLMASMTVLAERVSRAEALKMAKSFMPGKEFIVEKSSVPGGKEAKEPFYIFNVMHDGGFVLVSADDRVESILGYSEKGNVDINNIPENFKKWIEGYTRQFAALDEGKLVASSRAGTRGTKENIAPLLSSTWNQSEPYNLMCPDGSGKDYNQDGYNTDNRCVTGCVATAVAQIMYYYKHPSSSTTSIPAYTSKSISAQLSDLPSTTFQWNKMKDNYSYDETGESANAVAELMRYVGQAFEMDYNLASWGGSAAYIHNDAMINNFGYSKNIHSLSRDNYTTTQWENMIYDELAKGHPVPYDGQSGTGSGHQFVCDGYKDQDGNELFHLNWGWGGHLDGYFVLSIADPEGEQGIGGSSGAYQYDQSALINFVPAGASEEEIPTISSYVESVVTKYYSRTSASENFSGVAVSGEYHPSYEYKPSTTYPAEVGWGLYKDDNFVQCVGYQQMTIDNTQLDPGWYYIYTNSISAEFGAGLTDGLYQLRQIFRKQGASDWILCDDYGTNYIVAEINGTSLCIRGVDTGTESFTVNSISVSDKPMQGQPVKLKVNITNTGETNNEQVLVWLQKEGSPDWSNVASVKGLVGPGETGDVDISFTPDDSGKFTLKITSISSTDALETTSIFIAYIVSIIEGGIQYSCVPDYKQAIIISGGNDKTQETLTIPSTITADGVECKVISISDGAFWNWYMLQSLSLPEGIESIGENAFEYCYNLKKIVLPSTVNSIGSNAFYGIRNLSIVVSQIANPFKIDTSTFQYYNDGDQPSSATLYVPIGSKSKYLAYEGWTQFAKIEEGELKEAKVGDLYYNYSTGSKTAIIIQSASYKELKSITIPTKITVDGVDYKVTAISNNAFWNCYRLSSLAIPEGVETIGNNVFSYCFNLKQLELPSTLTSIGELIIDGNSSLESVISRMTSPINVPEIAFMTESWDEASQTSIYTPSSATLSVPTGSKSKYEAIAGWTKFAAIEEMPAEVPITFGEKPVTTYTASYNLDFSQTDDIKAYVATGYDYDSGTVWLTRVKDVPEGMPVMIMGTAKETYDIPVKLTSGTYFKNMFVANTTDGAIYPPETSGEMTNYYLSNGIFKSSTGSNPIGAGKCYLQIPTVAPTPVVGSSKDVTMNKNGYASFCANQDMDFTDVEGLKAYAATGYDDATGTIWLTRVKRVSAGTGLLLMGAADGEYTIPSTGVRSYYANMMVGNTSSETITIYTTSGDMTNYYLSGNKLLKAAAAGTAGNTIKPGKAYMQIPTAHVTRSIGDDPTEDMSVYDLLNKPEVISMQVMTRGMDGDDDTTGIRETMQPEQDSDVYYNLNGQRVENPRKGLYIHNGKKVVIK